MEIDSYLEHHGTKGMRWGIRRYQNKDGSLTPAGKKRYDKEMDKLKSEKKRLRNEERTKKKMDKLNQMKSDVDNMKKKKAEDEAETETPEAKRERLLKSTDAKELYENKNLLTTNELNERINRIDTEARLKSKITDERVESGVDYVNSKMKKGADTLNNVTNLYRKVDDAYSTVAKSEIGKMLAKQLGIEPPKKEFDLAKSWKNRNKLSNQEIQDMKQRVLNEKIIETEIDRRKEKADKKAKEQQEKIEREQKLKDAQKQVDDYYKKLMEESDRSGVYSKKQSDIIDSKWGNKPIAGLLEDKNSRNQYQIGQNYVAGLLEDKYGR